MKTKTSVQMINDINVQIECSLFVSKIFASGTYVIYYFNL